MGYNSTEQLVKLVGMLTQECNLDDDKRTSLLSYVNSIYESEVESGYSAPMLWIGLYIALGSLVCIVAMVADLLHGLHTRKMWFPCKYFRLNSFFLSVISVAMKLPMDLSGSMPGSVDQAAKLGSMAFMCTMMANLLPCLGTMNNNELLSNITALCVLVITLVVNVCIQIQTGVVSYKKYPNSSGASMNMLMLLSPRGEHGGNTSILAPVYVTLLLVLSILHVCSSLAILQSKKVIESKYQQGHDRASKDIQEDSKARELLKVEMLQNHVRNHWIMAGSGSPQFITTCYQTTTASGVICVLVTILHTRTMCSTIIAMLEKDLAYDSAYRWSTLVILMVQFLGVVIGTIAPLSRCFANLSFNIMSFRIISSHFKVFEVECYWTHTLHDWKRASIRLPFRVSHKLNTIIETLKRLILIFCIKFQEGDVIVCKIIALIPFMFMICALYSYHKIKALFRSSSSYENLDRNKDLRPYVLQLDDKILAERTLEGLSKSMKKLIQKGKDGQPNNLMTLIKDKSTRAFEGVEKLDNMHQNPKVKYQDSWSLTVVTLTTIARSLPKVENNEVESLLRSVREGLVYVRLVEETLNVNDDSLTVQKAAETLWQEVDVYHKWLGNKLQDRSQVNIPTSDDQLNTRAFEVKTDGQIVEWFKKKADGVLSVEGQNEDSIHKSICAISIDRITNTILLNHQAKSDDKVSQKELFDRLSSMIADIIAACLTNLPQVITVKCHTRRIEKRDESVKDAVVLLGETTQIIETLKDYDIPDMKPSDLPFIDKWCEYLRSP